MKSVALYVHIPFCVSKCNYCNFVSFVGCENRFSEYLDALKIEISKRKNECKNVAISSIYIGGGTPSILPDEYIALILQEIKQNYNVLKNAEISVEANPNSFTLKKAKIWAKAGVNRVSFGLQAVRRKHLKMLGRKHNFKDFKNAVLYAHMANIYNVNADLLIGLPKQNWLDVKRSLKKVIECGVRHISAYGLILEENTPLYKKVEKNKLKMPSDEKSVKIYKKTLKYLQKYAFFRYEISNFCQNGFECKHNINYWKRGEFIGFGVSAYSFFNKTHWENTVDLSEYIKNPDNKINVEKETIKTAKEEMIMLALRTDEGLDISEYNKKFKVHFIKEYQKQLVKLIKDGSISIVNNHLKVLKTEITNLIIEEFF